MKVLIEVPTWLGDCVMATPAIENIVKRHPNCEITIFGTLVAVAIFKQHPNVQKTIIDNSRQAFSRFMALAKIAKTAGQFDLVLSFRRQFSSRFFVLFAHGKTKANYRRYQQKSQHQVIRYNEFINKALKLDTQADKLKIYQPDLPKSSHKILGINPGASYGSAKRWYPQEFAKVATELSSQYDIMIFGGNGEVDIAADIEKVLIGKRVKNYQNLAGKTSLVELLEKIAQLDLFITGDSGPMHVAAAFQVPTVAIFGPTQDNETAQWMNEKSIIVKQNLDCQPCMQRICPLKGKQHHQCMKNIDTQKVLIAVESL